MEIGFEDWQINALAFKREKSVLALYLWHEWDWWSMRRWARRAPIHLLQIGVKRIYRFTMKALTRLIILQHFSNSSALAQGERTKPINLHLNERVKWSLSRPRCSFITVPRDLQPSTPRRWFRGKQKDLQRKNTREAAIAQNHPTFRRRLSCPWSSADYAVLSCGTSDVISHIQRAGMSTSP